MPLTAHPILRTGPSRLRIDDVSPPPRPIGPLLTYVRRVRRSWRWGVLVALVAALVALPFVVARLPVGSTGSDAAETLKRIEQSVDRPYAGYAETTGTLGLPVSDGLDTLASLLGGRTQQRVWWRSSTDWRADTITPTGEEGAHTTATARAVWDYEDNRAVVTEADLPGAVRLPRAADTLPPLLAARLLSEARPARVSTLPEARVAGRAADGLRLRPGDPLSSIDRVDVWADRDSGIPVRVDVYGRGAAKAALSSTFLDFDDSAPSASTTLFTPPPGARVRYGQRFDLVRQIGRFPDRGLPNTVLGYPRAASPDGLEGIGRYGRGVTQFAVGSLPGGSADSLRDQLLLARAAKKLPEGIALSVGPVGLLLTDPAVTGESWLLTGTLTPAALTRAATELRAANGAA